MSSSSKTRLYLTDLSFLKGEPDVIGYGAIMLCKSGNATVSINLSDWHLHKDAVLTLFPDDVVAVVEASGDFEVELLQYDKAMLREASLQLEQTVYSQLRQDRCRTDRQVVTYIIEGMFNLLRVYFTQKECQCLDQLVLCQLKAFFIGFYDWLVRNKHEAADERGSSRQNELLNQFMADIEQHYRQSHDVAYYAERLNITAKYLNSVVKRLTNHTAKTVIDHYIILQLKLQLRTTDMSIKQLAWSFNFSDSSFFCRYFKRHTGQTPQQFRMNIRRFNE